MQKNTKSRCPLFFLSAVKKRPTHEFSRHMSFFFYLLPPMDQDMMTLDENTCFFSQFDGTSGLQPTPPNNGLARPLNNPPDQIKLS